MTSEHHNMRPLPNADRIVRALGQFSITLSSEQVNQVICYLKLLLRWNEKVNLTAIRDPVEILYRHFCESMFGGIKVPIGNGRLADVGSGAGFPGMALKILRPELHVFLIEPNVKKATFLAEAVRELGLTHTRAIVARYEELDEEIAPIDYLCSRAVGELDRLLRWAARKELHTRHAVFWVGERDSRSSQAYPLWKWRTPVAMPHSLRRFLLIGERLGEGSPSGPDVSRGT